MTRIRTRGGRTHLAKANARAYWDEFFAGPKKVLPKNVDFDAPFEASYEK